MPFSFLTDNISGHFYYLRNTTLFQEKKYFRRIDLVLIDAGFITAR